jgi:hypothetical protein
MGISFLPYVRLIGGGMLLLLALPVRPAALMVYTGPVPDYMISTGVSLDSSSGLSIEILAGALRAAHITVRMEPAMPWTRAQAVAVHQAGAILPGLTRTSVRERQWKWLTVTYVERIYAVTLGGKPDCTSLACMKRNGLRVGVRLGSGTASLLRSIGISPDEAIDTDTSFSQLASGKIDVLLVQKLAVRPALQSLAHGEHSKYLAPLIPQLHYSLLGDEIPQWLVVSRLTSDDDARRLRLAMDAFRQSAQYRAIITKYQNMVPLPRAY